MSTAALHLSSLFHGHDVKVVGPFARSIGRRYCSDIISVAGNAPRRISHRLRVAIRTSGGIVRSTYRVTHWLRTSVAH